MDLELEHLILFPFAEQLIIPAGNYNSGSIIIFTECVNSAVLS